MGSQQAAWLALVQRAGLQVKQARLLDADWPAGTLEAADAALDAALVQPQPPPPPLVSKLYGFGVTYHYPNADHSPAEDVYLGTDEASAEWGVHWGHDAHAPASGVGSIYRFPTPLLPSRGAHLAHMTVDEYLGNHVALMRGVEEPGSCYYRGLNNTQTMFFALLTFDTPQPLRDGRLAKAIWIGHCRDDATVGRMKTGDRWCTTWNSGINFEADGIPALASHAHVAGTSSGQLTMNGDVSGLLVAALLGWQVRDAGVGPGPNEYMTGAWRAGKPASAWQGHALPPAPPGT